MLRTKWLKKLHGWLLALYLINFQAIKNIFDLLHICIEFCPLWGGGGGSKVRKSKLLIENIFNTKWNETQFETESQLQGETSSVTEIHFTPGTPFNFRTVLSYKF